MAGEFVPRRRLYIPLQADSIRTALSAMVDRLVEEGVIRDPEALRTQIAETALRDLVSVGPNVALPHLRTAMVDRLITAIGVAPAPLRTDEPGFSGAPRIIAMVLAPVDAASAYLQTLAVLGRLFHDPKVVERMLAARSTEDVLDIPQVRELSVMPRLAVKDVMTREVHWLRPDAFVRDAVTIFLQQGVRAVPVVGDTGEVLGMVTDRDLLRAMMRTPREGEEIGPGSPRLTRVRDVMSRSVLCISEDAGLDDVANTMINKDVDRLPVVREGALTGILTRGDIIRKLLAR